MKGIFLHFDLGYSYYSSASVKSLILDRLPPPSRSRWGRRSCGCSSGSRRDHLGGQTALDPRPRAMGTALVFVSVPVYWLGLISLYLFASDIGLVHIFPGSNSYVGLTADPGKWFTSLLLPWFVLAATFAAICRASCAAA